MLFHSTSTCTVLIGLLIKDWTTFASPVASRTLIGVFLNFKGELCFSSSLNTNGEKSDKILSICKALNADTYLSGPAGIDYLNLNDYKDSKIEVRFQNYNHNAYPQQNRLSSFIPRLSSLDYFLNVGLYQVAQNNILKNSEWIKYDNYK